MVDLAERTEGGRTSSQRVPDLKVPGVRVVLAGMLLAGLAAIIVARWLTGTGYVAAPFGLPDPGPITASGLPAAQFLHELAGIAVVGLLFLRCLDWRGPAVGGGPHLLQMASRWAWAWVAATLLWIVFTVSELAGIPVFDLAAHSDVVVAVVSTDRVLAELATLWVGLAIALFGARLSGPVATGAALLLATAALLPSALTGHAAHHDNPTIAVVALAIHLAAAAIWVGGLLALVVHLRPFQDDLARIVPRFSTAALVCVAAVGLSGVLESVVMLETWTALWESDRGHLIIAKTVALIVLAAMGYLHRQRTVGPASSGRLAPLLRLAAGELVIMGVTVGIAVVLSTTA
jgi:putative copper resistance protein D